MAIPKKHLRHGYDSSDEPSAGFYCFLQSGMITLSLSLTQIEHRPRAWLICLADCNDLTCNFAFAKTEFPCLPSLKHPSSQT